MMGGRAQNFLPQFSDFTSRFFPVFAVFLGRYIWQAFIKGWGVSQAQAANPPWTKKVPWGPPCGRLPGDPPVGGGSLRKRTHMVVFFSIQKNTPVRVSNFFRNRENMRILGASPLFFEICSSFLRVTFFVLSNKQYFCKLAFQQFSSAKD